MTKIAAALILLLLASLMAGLGSINLASANPDGTFPTLAMPIEFVNYTITSINGTLWATIDGYYPISILNGFNGDLPMVYPMPPGTTNIHVYLGEQELSWINYTQDYPDALHHTAIGDWGMIFCVLNNVSDNFVLKIHFQYPLETVNGSYLFLYDLNISPYLTPQNNNSTCNYTIRIETNTTNLHAYTTETDSQWNPINYTTTKQGTTQIVTIQEYSEYSKPLPGDLVVMFSDDSQVPEFPVLAIPALIIAAFTIALLYLKNKKLSPLVKARNIFSNSKLDA